MIFPCCFRFLLLFIGALILIFAFLSHDHQSSFAVFADASTKGFMEQNFYTMFGLTPRTFNVRALKKAYKQKALELHPDRNKAEDAEVKFTRLNHAYETLMDDSKRQVYDRYGEEGLKGGQFTDPEDIFAQFAGSLFRFRRPSDEEEVRQKSPSTFLNLRMSLEELYSGIESLEMDIDKQVICPVCSGVVDTIKCQACKGMGMRQVVMAGFFMQSTCEECHGKGKSFKSSCKACRGQRIARSHRETSITVEAGLEQGDQVVLEDAGDEHPDKMPGNIVLSIIQRPHPIFTRRGPHLYTYEPISLEEALIGFNKTLTHLDKSIKIPLVRMNENELTPNGYVETIKGMGMPIRGGGKGDLFVEYQVIWPLSLTDSQRKALKLIFFQEATKTDPGQSSPHDEL